MSAKITEVLNADTLKDTLKEDCPVEEIVDELFSRGAALANVVNPRQYADWEAFKCCHAAVDTELVELEGSSTINHANVVVLKTCPMAQEMAKLNVDGKPPQFHQGIIDAYMQQNPGSNAILHPGCIAHQVGRQIIVKELNIGKGNGNTNYYQLACRSGATGKVVYDENGLKEIGMSKEEAARLIDGFACLYVIIR
jgi:hypothetical protein